MAIYCSRCEMENPNTANFCMYCSNHLNGGILPIQQPPMRWEYKDLIIKLNNMSVQYGSKHWGEVKRAIDYLNNLIVEHLRYEGQNGWQAEGSTDFETLQKGGAVDTTYHSSLLAEIFPGLFDDYSFTYKSIRIRLKRLVR